MQPASQQHPRSSHSSGFAPKQTKSSPAGHKAGGALGTGPEGAGGVGVGSGPVGDGGVEPWGVVGSEGAVQTSL